MQVEINQKNDPIEVNIEQDHGREYYKRKAESLIDDNSDLHESSFPSIFNIEELYLKLPRYYKGDFIDIYKHNIFPESTKQNFIIPFDIVKGEFDLTEFKNLELQLDHLVKITIKDLVTKIKAEVNDYYYDIKTIYKKQNILERC